MGKKKWTNRKEKKSHHNKKQGGKNNKKNNKHHTVKPKEFLKRKEFPGKRDNASNNNWTPKNNLFEKDIGVTEYVTFNQGFNGVIKSRFSDFQVNEIDIDGSVVKLTDTSVPSPPKIDKSDITKNKQEVITIITQDIWDKICVIAASKEKNEEFVQINVDSMTKEQRSLIHNTVKDIHGKTIIGSTIDEDGVKYIKFTKSKKNVQHDRRTKWLWPHEYTYFVVHKENMDTMKVASDLAHNLNTSASSIAYAGTKDKRAKTSQLFCIRKRDPEKIARAAERLYNVHIGNYTFRPDTLKLGTLKGNRFRIVLRNITADEDEIEKSLTNLKESGFINYYGLQRFGNSASIPTHQIGLALLKGQFKEAIELILKPRDGEQNFMKDVRANWWKYRNAEVALKMLYKTNKGVEAKLLAGLAKHGSNDFINSLENVPRNMRLLYIHAYQSLIWNEIVSMRIKKYGLSLQVGDLVFVDEHQHENVNNEEISDAAHLAYASDETDQEITAENVENDVKDEQISSYKARVKPLTATDITANTYNIFDIVLPLPGHDIAYPLNDCGKWYEERLAKDDLTSDKLKQKQKTYSLTGAYRKMLVKPENFTWYFRKYETPLDNLILSDLETLKNESLPKIDDYDLKALIIDFCLPSSSYATMALREILREDTSAANQTKIDESGKEAVATPPTVEAIENINFTCDNPPVDTSTASPPKTAENGKNAITVKADTVSFEGKRQLEENKDELIQNVKKTKLDTE